MNLENKEVLEEAKELIRSVIDKFCNDYQTKYVCELASTKKGYEQLEQFILRRMIKGDTVLEAIDLQERVLDPNKLVD